MWTLEKLINKAVQPQKTNDSKSREPLIPKKFEAGKRAYAQFLMKRGLIVKDPDTEEEIRGHTRLIAYYGRELGIIISQASTNEKKKNELQNTDAEYINSGESQNGYESDYTNLESYHDEDETD